MGQGSTQYQHLVQTEVAPKRLSDWLARWQKKHDVGGKLSVLLRPHSAGSDILELAITAQSNDKLLNVVFNTIQDRRGRAILSVRDQNTFDTKLRRKRLMTLAHLFLIHRYQVDSIHYLTPSADNTKQAERMKAHGIYRGVNLEIGEIIVADVDTANVKKLVDTGLDGLL